MAMGTENEVYDTLLEDESELSDCAICLEAIKKHVLHTTSCGHTFCASCVDGWKKQKNNCPICRATL